jgi:peptidoglycan/xylan/chitin deacetylase (PgdA/CDA1 family)
MTLSQKIRSKLTRKAKNLSRDLQHSLGLYDSFYTSARGGRIMAYHGVCLHSHLKFNTIFLTQKTFESHLKFYKKYFNVISLDNYYQQKFSNDKFNICLTFDDGFANNHKYVWPLLEKYKMPATFFITAIQAAGYDILWNDFLSIMSKYGPGEIIFKDESYLKNRHNKYISTTNGISLQDKLGGYGFDEKAQMMKELYPLAPFKTKQSDKDYWLQMTTQQMKELAASPLATIGTHGYYHNDLARINIGNAAEELSLSKQYLENIIEKKISSIAFPYGSYNNAVVEAAKKAGYEKLLATAFVDAEDHDDTAMRERLTVNPFISVNNQMYATITGSYE